MGRSLPSWPTSRAGRIDALFTCLGPPANALILFNDKTAGNPMQVAGGLSQGRARIMP